MKLHWKIIIGLILGTIWGMFSAVQGFGSFTHFWVAPFGEIFINLLKFIAIPLVLTSLITGVASLSDMKKLSRIGGKTITIYILTTAISVTIGLCTVNFLKPGTRVPDEMKASLQKTYETEVQSKTGLAKSVKDRGPLEPVVEMVPSNFFNSASDNRNMLQVVFISILFGIGLIQVKNSKAKLVLDFFDGFNDVVIKLVDVIMLMAPIGVFALIAETINNVAGNDIHQVVELLGALGVYMLTVILALALHMSLTYSVLIKFFTKTTLAKFYRAMAPVQVVGFSTSSSGATLPVTMEACEKDLGISEEVSSFVLPLGATINMDGTAAYQAVAAVFIAQTLGIQLGLSGQLTIIFTAILASIGTAAVPGAGIIMLVIILESVGIPSAGIALILGVDRILDMLRTTTNITGDAAVALVVATNEGEIEETTEEL